MSSPQPPRRVQRAAEPLVPVVDVNALNKSIHADLKELRRASEHLSKLAARKNNSSIVAPHLVEISAAARERARSASSSLREAFDAVVDGSPEHAALEVLLAEFKQTLSTFQQQVEATARLAGPAMLEATATQVAASDVDGALGRFDRGAASNDERLRAFANATAQGQQQQVACEQVIAQRERGIDQLVASVQEVSNRPKQLYVLR